MPLIAILLMTKFAVPVFCIVSVWGLLEPRVTLPKGRLVTDKVATGAVPMPLMAVLIVAWLLLPAVITICATRLPNAVGLNMALMVQVAAGAIAPLQVLVWL